MPLDMPPVDADSVAAAIEKEKEGAKIEYVQQQGESSSNYVENLMQQYGVKLAPKMEMKKADLSKSEYSPETMEKKLTQEGMAGASEKTKADYQQIAQSEEE
jgi:hypothetical protein